MQYSIRLEREDMIADERGGGGGGHSRESAVLCLGDAVVDPLARPRPKIEDAAHRARLSLRHHSTHTPHTPLLRRSRPRSMYQVAQVTSASHRWHLFLNCHTIQAASLHPSTIYPKSLPKPRLSRILSSPRPPRRFLRIPPSPRPLSCLA